MNATKRPVICIACGVFEDELRQLEKEDGALPYEIRYLDSMLHMDPEKLSARLFSAIKQERDQDSKVLLLYGDCHPNMCDMVKAKDVKRPPCVNCCQLLLGRDRYHELQQAGTFFLMPEWVKRRREVFESHLGLTTEAMAHLFMKDFFRQIVYIDPGLIDPPQARLDEIAAFSGLPVVIEPATLEHFRRGIGIALQALKGKDEL